jgi:hypothetical protein
MNTLINAMTTNDALTLNDALTHTTTNNNVLDLFFVAGASRTITEESIELLILKAWTEEPLQTLKIIFWAGDIRSGAGERRFFKIALNWLQYNQKTTLINNILASNIEEFNRYDSLFELTEDEDVKKTILKHINSKLELKDGLLAKWLPRKKTYNNFKKVICDFLKLSDEQYRKLIVPMSNTVEQKISSNKWKDINYSAVPSQAFNKYRQAFLKNDESRFNMFIESVNQGKSKINASVIYPHQLFQAFNQGKDKDSIIAQWNNLPNYMLNSNERILPVCDVSGSMSGLPMDVSIALGLYISERNTGIFKDAFVTFSENPELNYLKGNFADRIQQLQTASWGYRTDLQKTFDLILNSAMNSKISQEQMPTILLIISDMEFDSACNYNNYELIEKKYKISGYKLPKIVFWNVNGRDKNNPVKSTTNQTAMISGFSPSVLEAVLGANLDNFTPINIMLKTINNPRYERIIL